MKKQRMCKLVLNREKISRLITEKIKGGTDLGTDTFLLNLPGVGNSNDSQCVNNCTQTVINCE